MNAICPFCGRAARYSPYLRETFAADPNAAAFAELVTHYRHEHVRSYDRTLHSPSYARANRGYRDYDSFKAEVNNRAKRQLMRAFMRNVRLDRDEKAAVFLAALKMQANDDATTSAPGPGCRTGPGWLKMQANDDATTSLARDFLRKLGRLPTRQVTLEAVA